MTNSPLATYTKISPNKTSPRNHTIDTITIHHMTGNCSIEVCGDLFNNWQTQASSNYGIDSTGTIALFVDENDRSWCTSNRENDNRSVTIEVANDGGEETGWHVSDEAYFALVKLLVDICKRNNIKELKWQANKNLIGQIDKQNMTVHRWFSNTECPGDYLYNNMGDIAQRVNALLTQETIPELTKEEAKQIVKEKAQISDQTIDYIAEYYKWGEPLIIKLAKAILKGDK